MKKYLLLLFAVAITFSSTAQGNGKGKGNGQNKSAGHAKKSKDYSKSKTHDEHGDHSTTHSTTGKSSKNQPSKVRDAFQRDYPNAGNVVWSKYKGDWTATFNNGISRSTAVYHANGDRRDTRTNISRTQLPGSIWDRVFKRDRVTPVGSIVQIQPTVGSEIFRIASRSASSRMQYLFYNTNGERVQYNY